MRDKLDVVHRVIADWTQAIDAEMATRAAALTAANIDLDTKMQAAKASLTAVRNAHARIERTFKHKIRPSQADKSKFNHSTWEYEHAQEIVTKLETAQVMMASLQRDDETRRTEITVQNNKIAPLWTALNDKVVRGDAWDDADKANYKKIIQAEDIIKDIHTQILKNKQRIGLFHRMASIYDVAHPEQFPGYWLNIASVIVEQQDIYGFHGEIIRRVATQAEGSGLEGYSVAYGAVLKKGEVVRYTKPGSKILIEQDHTGRVFDKTPHSVSDQDKALAAIKTAHLLLLDRTMHPEKKMYLRGSKDYLPQVKLVVAALLVEAKQAGLVLKLENLTVDVPGWTDWLGSTRKSLSESNKLQVTINGVIGSHHAQDDLKEKVREIKGKSLLADEPAIRPRQP